MKDKFCDCCGEPFYTSGNLCAYCYAEEERERLLEEAAESDD